MMLGSVMSTLSEGLTLTKELNLPLAEVLQVIDQGAMSSPVFRTKGPSIVAENFAPHFPLKHAQKDMKLALELAESVGVSLPVVSAANEQYLKVLEEHGDEDFSAVHFSYQNK